MRNKWFGAALFAALLVCALALLGCPTDGGETPPKVLYKGANTTGKFTLNEDFSFSFIGPFQMLNVDSATVTGKITEWTEDTTGNLVITGELYKLSSSNATIKASAGALNGTKIILTFNAPKSSIGTGKTVTISSDATQQGLMVQGFFGGGGAFVLE